MAAMPRILVATSEGLRAFDERGRDDGTELAGRSVTAVVRDGSQLWAIVESAEIWHAPKASGASSRSSMVRAPAASR